MQLLALSICVIRHPIDTFRAILSHRKKANFFAAIVLMLAVVLTRIIYIFIVHYPFADVLPEDTNFTLEVLVYLVPVISWAVANFAMTSILDGETTMTESITASAFCMMPFILLEVPLALLTRLLSLDDRSLVMIVNTVLWCWVLGLFMLSVKVMNNYSMAKTVLISVLNLLTMALMWAICLLMYALASQFFQFLTGVAKELRYAITGT